LQPGTAMSPKARLTRGYEIMWSKMHLVRDVQFDSFEAVKLRQNDRRFVVKRESIIYPKSSRQSLDTMSKLGIIMFHNRHDRN